MVSLVEDDSEAETGQHTERHFDCVHRTVVRTTAVPAYGLTAQVIHVTDAN